MIKKIILIGVLTYMYKKNDWMGIFYPSANNIFNNYKKYYIWYKSKYNRFMIDTKPKIGILFPRSLWINDDLQCIKVLIEKLEKKGLFPIPVFSEKKGHGGTDCPTNIDALKYFKNCDIIINLQSSFLICDFEKNKSDELLKKLNIPIIQGIHLSHQNYEDWISNPAGLNLSTQVSYVIQPEYNGVIEPVVISYSTKNSNSTSKRIPIVERIEFLIKRIKNWIALSKKSNNNKKITFLLHNNPCSGVETTLGRASGLDTFESMVNILKKMKQHGYTIENCPKTGQELLELFLHKKAFSDFRWTTVEEIIEKKGILAYITETQYIKWFDKLSKITQKKIINEWGEFPGESMSYENKLLVTGIQLGNIKIIIEPKRGCYGAKCDGEVCKILHNPEISPTHQCIAVFKWINENSDAIVSVGTHGYIEFLPGKTMGLTNECFPEILIGTKPHIYIYIVKNSSEGVIARRRAYAVLINHLSSIYETVQLPEYYVQIESLISEIQNPLNKNNNSKKLYLKNKIIEICKANKIFQKEISDQTNLDKTDLQQNNFNEILHNKINLFQTTLNNIGLHTLGKIPETKVILKMLFTILKSFPEYLNIKLFLESKKKDLCKLSDYDNYKKFKIENYIKYLLKNIILNEIEINEYFDNLTKILKENQILNKFKNIFQLIKDVIYPNFLKINNETENIIRVLDKKFICSGKGGLLTKGQYEILPTGRNTYGINPENLPTKTAWEIGKQLAEKLLKKYYEENGKYPKCVGMILWSIDCFRNDGEQVAQILYLLGVKPIWSESNKIISLEIISLENLKRPRIDVLIKISGVFRETLPHIISLLDKAIKKVANLSEKNEMNFIKNNIAKEIKNFQRYKLEKLNEKELKRIVTFRIFCPKPKTYSSGLGYVLAASAWREEKELAEIFINRNGFAYGTDDNGIELPMQFAEKLENVEVIFHKSSTDESNILSGGYYASQGGMNLAIKTISDNTPSMLWGDTRNINNPIVRKTSEELERIVCTRLLNHTWIKNMKKHNYKGAGEMLKNIVTVYKWDAVSNVIPDVTFDNLVETHILNDEMNSFYKKNNIYGLEEVTRRFLEAEKRGIWKASPKIFEKLKQRYLEIEGFLEEKEGSKKGEFQGGNIDIITKNEISDWKQNIKLNIDEIINIRNNKI
jgi:cobaltochelatase CobN